MELCKVVGQPNMLELRPPLWFANPHPEVLILHTPIYSVQRPIPMHHTFSVTLSSESLRATPETPPGTDGNNSGAILGKANNVAEETVLVKVLTDWVWF
jgi:hypothetical protein